MAKVWPLEVFPITTIKATSEEGCNTTAVNFWLAPAHPADSSVNKAQSFPPLTTGQQGPPIWSWV